VQIWDSGFRGTSKSRLQQIFDAFDPLDSTIIGWEYANRSGTQFNILFRVDDFEEMFLSQLVGVSSGWLIILAGGPVTWTTIGTAVLITGVSMLAIEAIAHLIQKQSQAGQKADYDWALEKLRQGCGKTLDRSQRRRVHDKITGREYSREEILEVMKDVAGCH
jgi:hypothetical protein